MSKVDPRVSNLLLPTTIWRSDVWSYISGYIVKKLLSNIDCPDCAAALHVSSEGGSNFCNLSLSLFIFHYCHARNIVNCWYHQGLSTKLLIEKHVFHCESGPRCLKKQMPRFYPLFYLQRKMTSQHYKESHILEQSLRDDHITTFTKEIIKQYLVIFYHQFGKLYTQGFLKNKKASKK